MSNCFEYKIYAEAEFSCAGLKFNLLRCNVSLSGNPTSLATHMDRPFHFVYIHMNKPIDLALCAEDHINIEPS